MNTTRSKLLDLLPACGLAMLVTLGFATSQSSMLTAVKVTNIRQAPAAITRHFDLGKATLQDFALPGKGWQSFMVTVYLSGASKVLALSPKEVLAPNYKLYVADAKGLREVKPAAPSTYQGEVVGQADSSVSASLVEGQLSAVIRIGDKSWGIEPASKAQPKLPRTTHIVFQSSDSTLVGLTCANVNPVGPVVVFAAGGGNVGPLAQKVAEIGIDADYDFYLRKSSNVPNTENAVKAVINSVNTIYKRDAQIEHLITRIIVRTSRVYTSTYLPTVLSQFRSRWNALHGSIQRDLAHCFSGKGSFSGILGVAYLGVVCNRSAAYAVSKTFHSRLDVNTGLVAHETGHNWSAPHCGGSSCNIMCAGLGGCSRNITRFGASSINRIVGFKNTRSCLSDPKASKPPTLTYMAPTSVSVGNPSEITLTGTNMDSVDKILVGPSTVTFFTKVSSSTLKFRPPPGLNLTTHAVRVANAAGASLPKTLTVIAQHPSMLATPPFIARTIPYSYGVWTDKNWGVIMMFSNLKTQSQLPGLVDLGIGGNFGSLFLLPVLFAGNNGGVSFNMTIPLSVPSMTIYWQAVTFNPAKITLPFEVSNVGSTVIF